MVQLVGKLVGSSTTAPSENKVLKKLSRRTQQENATKRVSQHFSGSECWRLLLYLEKEKEMVKQLATKEKKYVRCETVKSLSEFAKNILKDDGLQNLCRECDTCLNRGDIVRATSEFLILGTVLVSENSLGQIIDICRQHDLREEHPFSYQVQWFVDDGLPNMLHLSWLPVSWFAKCLDICDSCKDRLLCFSTMQNIEPISQEELDDIGTNWEDWRRTFGC